MQFTIFLSHRGGIERKIRSVPQFASVFPLLSPRLFRQSSATGSAAASLQLQLLLCCDLTKSLYQSIIYNEICITCPDITLALAKHHGGSGALLEGSEVCGHCPVKPWHLRCSVSSMHRDASSLPSDSSNSVFPACTCLFEPVMGQEWDILLQ